MRLLIEVMLLYGLLEVGENGFWKHLRGGAVPSRLLPPVGGVEGESEHVGEVPNDVTLQERCNGDNSRQVFLYTTAFSRLDAKTDTILR